MAHLKKNFLCSLMCCVVLWNEKFFRTLKHFGNSVLKNLISRKVFQKNVLFSPNFISSDSITFYFSLNTLG